MKTKTAKKIFIVSASVLLLLAAVLSVHIYLVTRPKAPDANTRIMARVDIKQDISQEEADRIRYWFAHEKGIDNVMCNTINHNIVFTYFPVKNNASQIVQNFRSNFNISVQQYIPTEQEMMAGCPVASNSKTYKFFSYIKHLF